MGFRIRNAEHDDLPAVGMLAGRLVRMHHELDPKRWMMPDGIEAGYARYFGSQLGNQESIILVAEDEENREIVAYAYAALEPRSWPDLRDACGKLHDIFVDERARRQGLAKAMLKQCLHRLTALGAPLAVLTTAWQNRVAQALLRSLGFRAVSMELVKDLEPRRDAH